MSYKNKTKLEASKKLNAENTLKSVWVLAFGFLSCLPNYAVGFEQSQDSDQAKPDTKVIVTGSRLKKIDLNELSPILSISREDIDKQGFATVKDVIDGLTQNTGGTMDNSFTFGFTPAASSVNIRGVGFGHTLVLIDGRRLPIYPVGISGTSNFVDLSAIPMAFVERIDVLTDGASAIYGSDAVSGVINVITRKDIEGISLNYRYGKATSGGYQNHRFNLMTGARNGDTQIDFIFDIWSQAPLWARDRAYAESDVANPQGQYSGGGVSFIGFDTGEVFQHPQCGTENDPLGGEGVPNVEVNYFNPNEVWCGFDRAPYRQLIAPQDRFSLMTRLSYEINSDLALFSRVGFSNSKVKTQLEPNFYGGALFNGFGTSVPNMGGILAPNAINNPTAGTADEQAGVFVRRLVEFGPRISEYKSNAVNLLIGLEGTLAQGKYDWELGVSYNRTNLDTNSNNILLSGLNSAVDYGLDLFEKIPESEVRRLSFDANRSSYSSNQVIDFSLSGDLPFSLAAGPVQFAVAFEHVDERYDDKPDPLILAGDAFDGTSSGKGERNHLGIGGELNLPISENLEVDVAIRWDDYKDDSDVNGAFSPRFAVGYRPFDSLLLRGSWGKSFRAPDMQRLFGGDTQSFVDIVDPAYLIDENGAICNDPQAPNCNPGIIQSVNLTVGSNINLEEEEGSNLGFGAVWEVNRQLDISLDYFDIRLDKVVTTLSAQALVDICFFTGVLCDFVQRDVNGTLFGSDAEIYTGALNFAEQDTRGLDLVVNYQWNNSAGDFLTKLSITYVDELQTRFSEETERVENVGLGVLPEYRANFLFDWQKADYGLTAKLSFIDEMAGLYCFECEKSNYQASWTTLSLSGRYSLNEFIQLRLGLNNLTNRKPPTDPTENNWPWFRNSDGYYSAVGREVYFQIDASF
ncbi:TonB-dependent receptor [Aliikangiella sp. IMCC44653]